MLVAAVSYFVVPMFQLTHPYPLWFARGFGPAVAAAGADLVALWLLGEAPGARCRRAAGAAVRPVCRMTLWLQFTRRRKIDDATSLNFRVAMLALLTFAVSAAADGNSRDRG
jgi:hypothetical protein